MQDLMQKITSLAKRRGFLFPSSEIYGGFGSCYDAGPLGVELKHNIKKAWWKEMTRLQDNVVGLDSSVLMSPKAWEASGHLSAGFADELVECKKCHKRFNAEGMENKCPECGGVLTKPKKFDLMMETHVGPVKSKENITYLRPETAQGIYVNFLNVLNSMRLKLPFGIAQIGKAFRNEITPGNFIYRLREFEQMEMQWFCNPKDAKKFFNHWKKARMKWYLDLGIKKSNLRVKVVPKGELPHYAKEAIDIEYKFPFGWKEIEGIHNRGDWDLSNHSKHSGQDLKYEGKFPYIIETSAGVERSMLTFLVDAFQEVKGARTKTTKAAKETETLLKLDKALAPVKVAVLPLVRNKPELIKLSKEVYEYLKTCFYAQYDELGSIGRRYRRQDEIGTPISITCDFESLKKNNVTLRDRDSMKQKRVKIKDLVKILEEELGD